MKSTRAFTLIELSIVIVIIGLIVGAVFVGNDLILASQRRAQIGQFASFHNAARAFKLKYNALPGDLLKSSGLSFTFPGSSTSNGNGLIEDSSGNIPSVTLWQEPYFFFIQLSDAGMIEGQYTSVSNNYVIGTQFPRAKLNSNSGIIPFTQADAKLGFYFGITSSSTTGTNSVLTLSAGTGALSPDSAYAIDSKIDDGLPVTGLVKAMMSLRVADTTNNSCLTSTAANQYYVGTSDLNCRITAVFP